MADELTLARYDAEREALEAEGLGALRTLEGRYLELRWWYGGLGARMGDRLDDRPSDPALWRARADHPEHTRSQFRDAHDAARLRRAELHYDEVQMLRRWAWDCAGTPGACPDVLNPATDDGDDHMARHKHAIEVVRQAIFDASWPIVHWGRHLDQQRCILMSRPS